MIKFFFKYIDRLNEAISEFDKIKKSEDVCLGANLALIYAHNKCMTVDLEAILELEKNIQQDSHMFNEKVGLKVILYFIIHTQNFLLKCNHFRKKRLND